jgi:hypothetical protein
MKTKTPKIPKRFADAIKSGCRRAGIRPTQPARPSSVGPKVSDWMSGRSAPALTSNVAVTAIEKTLRLPPDPLLSRVRDQSARRAADVQSLPNRRS